MKWMIAAGNFFFRFRNFVFPAVFIPLALLFQPVLLLNDARWDRLLNIIGFLIAAAGQALRVAVIGYAYIKRGGKKKRIYAAHLVQEGFFAHCRNPLYVGNFLTILGLVIIHNSPWLYLTTIPFFTFAYLAIVLAEENYLRGQFGVEYDDYCRRVSRFMISFKGLRQSLADMSFDWKRVIRKDYGTVFTWVSCALGLFALESDRFATPQSRDQSLLLLAVLWTCVLAAWILARIFKKTGALGVD